MPSGEEESSVPPRCLHTNTTCAQPAPPAPYRLPGGRALVHPQGLACSVSWPPAGRGRQGSGTQSRVPVSALPCVQMPAPLRSSSSRQPQALQGEPGAYTGKGVVVVTVLNSGHALESPGVLFKSPTPQGHSFFFLTQFLNVCF